MPQAEVFLPNPAIVRTRTMDRSDARRIGQLWREKIELDALASRVVAALWDDRANYATPIMDRARGESPIMDAVIQSDLAETRRHVLAHFDAMLSLPTDRMFDLGDDPLAFVREHGARRARGGVPLLALLQAYRTGHKSFWAAICDKLQQFSGDTGAILNTAMLLSEYLIDYTDLISRAVTHAYLAEERLLVAHRTRLSVSVLEALLRGAMPEDREGIELCEHTGIGAGRSMAVFVVRRNAPDGFSSENRSAIAWKLRTLIGEAFGCLIDLRHNEIVGVIACDDDAGRRLAESFSDALELETLPRDARLRIGIGLNANRIEEIPRSYSEAVAAIEIGEIDAQILHLASVSVDTYLRYRADVTARMLAPPWCQVLRDGEFEETLKALAAASLNIKKCANALKLHNNTIYHRLNRVKRLTGIDPRSYEGLSRLLSALAISSNGHTSANGSLPRSNGRQ
jgi:hypothetical protein